MTCRDLIIYILENGLENEPVVKNGVPVGFMTIEQIAVELSCGTATIQSLIKQNKLDYISIGHKRYIPIAGGEKCPEK